MELTAEFGSNMPINFLKVEVCDEDGTQFELPKCPNCGIYKQMIMGENACDFFCWNCNQ